MFPAKQDIIKELLEGDHADYNIITTEDPQTMMLDDPKQCVI